MSLDENRQKVVKFVQELLLDEEDKAAITPALIAAKIDMVIAMKPSWGHELDRDAVTTELIRRFSLWIGEDAALKSESGHEAWLSAARKRDWRYWQRYREWLERKLSWKAVDGLDKSTDTILGLLEDPLRTGSWDRRGLVVGHVQSGKTGNYTGLITKAADAGYKIIIVLAGMHNNLRSQTQMRLDEGFLGYETNPVPEDLRAIGVGLIDADPDIRPNYATNRSDTGDFNAATAQRFGIKPEQRPWLFVVKKNKTVLERLHKWIRNHVANAEDPATGRKTVTHLPLLVIDDEADHASVDTGEQVFDGEGNADADHEPTAINSLIRKILHSFNRSAYVGYTATPFANIFIHERGETAEEGPDLFPSAFIVNLSAPSNYVGPAAVFGLSAPEGRKGGLPLIKEVDDCSSEDGMKGWMPAKHRSTFVPVHDGDDILPPSLVEAVDSFILACCVRQVRGQGKEHSSMLIHVTRFTAVQKEVRNQVDEHVRQMRQRVIRKVDSDALMERLNVLWTSDFVPAMAAIRERVPESGSPEIPSWEEILSVLPDTLEDIDVREINGTSKDALDYADNEGPGLKVIAIGGDKLARGLTLEGLCVSYFLRASKMYDTLMQMGRWFGYRPGYLDVCRLYTTNELIRWFGIIADASEELREEFDLMADRGATPREYGLRVQSHPELMVTSRLKMRAAKDLMISFSGELLETVVFHKRADKLRGNLAAAHRLFSSLGAPDETTIERRTLTGVQAWSGALWRGASASDVIDFFNAYQTHPESHKVQSRMIAEFIESMNGADELSEWTVALIGVGDGKGDEFPVADGLAIKMLERTNNGKYDDRYSIGRLMSPRDEAIDADFPLWKAALEKTRHAWKPDPARARDGNAQHPPEMPSGRALREIRGDGAPGVDASRARGLLLLYFLDPQRAGLSFPTDTPPVVAFGVSFPGSKAGKKVLYKVNSVEWRQWELDYGPAE
jgi:Z1 domain